MKEEKRIYVVVPATVQVPTSYYLHNGKPYVDNSKELRTVLQPAGRQIAQACHVVSKLRHELGLTTMTLEGGRTVTRYEDIATIILQGRDTKELGHVYSLLIRQHLKPVVFSDTNVEAYGTYNPVTAMAVLATPTQVRGITDYIPLWGS